MLNFRLQQLYLERKHKYFLPLPKLNDEQLRILSERLVRLGYKLRAGWKVRASMGSAVLWFERGGIAYSSSDLVDPIAPIIPKVLEVEKKRVTPRSLSEMYYATNCEGKSLRVRFNTRIESLSTWKELRVVDESGLTPDEALVLKVLLGRAKGSVRVVADYPNETARIIQIGRRLYFDSSLDVDEFRANLRILGQRNQRNTYLPRNCMLDLANFKLPEADELSKLSSELGEWCYYST